jgi:hypothetical protein
MQADFCNTLLSGEIFFGKILDNQVILAGNLFGMRNRFVPQTLSKLRSGMWRVVMLRWQHPVVKMNLKRNEILL